MAPLSIGIIGASVGGPAAAIGLARQGHKVTIYERSTETSEVGYAFRITPNSDRCLKYLGIDTIAGGAVAANSGRLMDARGNLLHTNQENSNTEVAKRGTSVFAHRPQLHQQLMQVVSQSGVDVKIGVKIRSVDVEGTKLVLEDGLVIPHDLILAADGVHSVTRPAIVDATKHFPISSTGHNCFRFMVSKEAAQKDPVMSSIVSDDARMLSWTGGTENSKRIIVYPVDFDRQFNINCTHPQELSDKEASGSDAETIEYNQKASFETVLDIYKDFDPAATRLFHLADDNGFRIWKLQDMDEIPHWSRNRTALLGDAAHLCLPFGFSGASMAIEDAVTLAELLPADDVSLEDIPSRLRLYEEIRRPRVARVRETARQVARGLDSREILGPYMQFLAEHDAVLCARNALGKSSQG
ncbi:MAG: hypothetical protein Q9220_005032 [cf. Caloplaca sp. 1 TL-2023]